ncbi:hypothetical protein QBC35DRAFT_547175 [Podospora australis]|uniref:Ecp2 effector protein domain-containing protein n=1 Tax=Podospora australis TaxID=1536484 RepID=A0AAN7ANB1_9PEZI|nr:hypothetical protein QBC35DRAFT_547175 [Podospora australis]
MKSSSILSAAAFSGLAAAQSTGPVVSAFTPGAQSSSPAVWTSPATSTAAFVSSSGAPSGAPDANAALCGHGFTYCGYILRDHQNFRQEDIVKAYCAGAKDNCANGKTKTDPIQALYVCVPPEATPQEEQKDNNNNNNNNLISPDAFSPDSSSGFSPNPAVAAVSSISSTRNFFQNFFTYKRSRNPWHTGQTDTEADDNDTKGKGKERRDNGPTSGGGVGGGNSCSSTATPGNRIELICSCGNSCLNPESDHIGRCDVPCS